MATNTLRYDVNAGKFDYDGQAVERNYKYCDSFATLEEALTAYDNCEGYAFREILYKREDNTVVELITRRVR